MKKIVSILFLTSILCFATALASCDTPSDNPSQKNDETEESDVQDEKVVLAFEIDEGLGGYEFVAGCKTLSGEYDYNKIDIVLNNIYDGLSKFDASRYIPAVHIYPTWYYKEAGWNTKHTDGLQKWSDDFIYAMDFFNEKGIKVYLEYMSSTVYVAQNGEEGLLPCVNINAGISEDVRNVWGVPCDIQSIEALKNHYPDTFVGVRYHELLGTKSIAATGNPHACDIDPEDVKYFSHYFKDMGLEIIWSDHSFGLMYSKPAYAFWIDEIKAVRDDVGGLLTLMTANNSWPVDTLKFTNYLQLQSEFPDVAMGYSNQAWWLDQLIINDTKCNKYESYPVELIAGFTQKAIVNGARIVQFEPYFDLFNYTRQSINGRTNYAAGGIAMNKVTPRYEEIQSDSLDYSPRLELYRLADYMNAKVYEFKNVEKFFDTSESKVLADSSSNPPVTFEQTSVCLVGDSVTVVDRYNYNNTKWLVQSANRFTSKVDFTTLIAASRTSFCYGGFDDFIIVNKVDGNNVGTLFNSICSKILEDETTFADNADGTFIGFTSANLIQNKTSRNKDADELVVYRQKGDVINISIYQSNSAGSGYNKVTGSATSILLDFFGGYSISATNFVGIYGIRNDKVVGKKSYLRSLDGLVAVYNDNNTLSFVGKKSISSPELNQTLVVDGNFVGITFADGNMDINSNDELLLIYNKEGNNKLVRYNILDNGFEKTEDVLNLGSSKINYVFNFERLIYQNSTNQ